MGGKGRLRAHGVTVADARTRTCHAGAHGWVDWETIRPDQTRTASSDSDLTYQSLVAFVQSKKLETEQ
jgi:hypothetical protein